MWLLAGLGNPGSQYVRTRHNVGYMALDTIAKDYGFSSFCLAKQSAMLAEGHINGELVLAVKPLSYMNCSGQSVGALLRFYKLPSEQLLVFHDDLDILPGKISVKRGGSSGGHNGLKSISEDIGIDYWRIRIGIGHPGNKDRVTSHVLGNFSSEESAWLAPLLNAISKSIDILLDGNSAQFVHMVSTLASTTGRV